MRTSHCLHFFVITMYMCYVQVLNVLLTCALMAKIRAEDAKYPPLYYTDDDELLSLRDVYNAQRSIDRWHLIGS